jgi:hypothetical protein
MAAKAPLCAGLKLCEPLVGIGLKAVLQIPDGWVDAGVNWAKSRSSRPSSLNTAAPSCRIDSAPSGRVQCFCFPFTRVANSPASDSTRPHVVGGPARRDWRTGPRGRRRRATRRPGG